MWKWILAMVPVSGISFSAVQQASAFPALHTRPNFIFSSFGGWWHDWKTEASCCRMNTHDQEQILISCMKQSCSPDDIGLKFILTILTFIHHMCPLKNFLLQVKISAVLISCVYPSNSTTFIVGLSSCSCPLEIRQLSLPLVCSSRTSSPPHHFPVLADLPASSYHQ